jgi:hypothetical protein
MTITFQTRIYWPGPHDLIEFRMRNGIRWTINIHLN